MTQPTLQEAPADFSFTDLLEQIESALRLRNPKLRSSLLEGARQTVGLSRDRFLSLIELFQTGGLR
jgi:hypothetical protein